MTYPQLTPTFDPRHQEEHHDQAHHTVRYRVTKLERMLGEFANDTSASLRIGVALEILSMYEVSGDTL